jgi:putative flippase GtrA
MTVTTGPTARRLTGWPNDLGDLVVAWNTDRVRRLWRYALTSLVATAVSEGTLLGLYGTHALDASAAAVAAAMTGAVPSYAMSRFWIWPEADRRRPGRQASAFWVVALISLGLSSLATGAAAANAPSGRGWHMAVVALAYVGTYGTLWVLKYLVYGRWLFRLPPSEPEGQPTPA